MESSVGPEDWVTISATVPRGKVAAAYAAISNVLSPSGISPDIVAAAVKEEMLRREGFLVGIHHTEQVFDGSQFQITMVQPTKESERESEEESEEQSKTNQDVEQAESEEGNGESDIVKRLHRPRLRTARKGKRSEFELYLEESITSKTPKKNQQRTQSLLNAFINAPDGRLSDDQVGRVYGLDKNGGVRGVTRPLSTILRESIEEYGLEGLDISDLDSYSPISRVKTSDFVGFQLDRELKDFILAR